MSKRKHSLVEGKCNFLINDFDLEAKKRIKKQATDNEILIRDAVKDAINLYCEINSISKNLSVDFIKKAIKEKI